MKICLVVSNSTIAEHAVYNSQELGLARALIRHNVSVDICRYAKKAGDSIAIEVVQATATHTIRLLRYAGWRLPGQQAFSPVLLRYLWRNAAAYDVLQVHDSTQIMSVLVAWLARRRAVPCVLYQGMYRDFDAGWKKNLQRIYDWATRGVFFNSLDRVVGKTTEAVRYVKHKGMPAALTACVIPVGLDTTVFCEAGSAGTGDIPRGGVSYDVLYVGKLQKQRQSVFLSLLLAAMCAQRHVLRACVIGTGPQAALFLKNIQAALLSGQVTYIASLENKKLPAVYQKTKVLLHPTTVEIFGMTILEAMYFGVPVIASPEAGPRHVIADGQDGILISGFDVHRWKQTIFALLDDKARRAVMARRAREKIRQRYEWTVIAPQFKAVYEALTVAETAVP